ncbi:MAG TPA: ACP S-malonyltransferase [Chromatiaceae bacterium]|nr:ACP S-malonyltransferase [Chromatiaceae bacterium]
MNNHLAFVFPGQGSQALGMSNSLAEVFPQVRSLYEEASDALGLDLWKLVTEGPEEELDSTENTQPAMLTAGVAVYRVWLDQGGVEAAMMAGHSLGEYTALVASGAMDFADAVKLVAARGRFMQEAVPVGTGAMAAILGLDDDKVRDLCERAAEDEVVAAVNFNSPGQVVIAGNKKAVQRAMVLAREAGARRALPLPVSVPSHCTLMEPAAEQLTDALESIELKLPSVPVVHNVDVATADSVKELREKLVRQLSNPVRWVETILAMKDKGLSRMIEAGPGKVLTGLGRRIDKRLEFLPVYDPASLENALEEIHV